MQRKGNPLPLTQDDLAEPPRSDPGDWGQGALSVSSFCAEFDIGRAAAYTAMKDGRLVWGRMGRQRRISRKSAAEFFASKIEPEACGDHPDQVRAEGREDRG